jgi:outer membrane biogenesis lipoprotein LolB
MSLHHDARAKPRYPVSIMKTHYAIALAALLLTGCTAARSMSAINMAAVTVEEAEAVQAQTHAVYQYTRATEHLRMARLESNVAEYAASEEHAKQATDWAQQAFKAAKKQAAILSRQTLTEPTL